MVYDIIIPVATKDAFFVHRTVKYIRKNLLEADRIYIITNRKNFRLLKKITQNNQDVFVLNENELVADLSFGLVKNELQRHKADCVTGWFFQQFLKLGFAKSQYARQYYVSWDADTLPLTNIPFKTIENRLIFDCKKEYHKPYFIPIKKLLKIGKVIDRSFIAEHMLFEKDKVEQMLSDIEANNIEGSLWWQKILNACDFSDSLNCFSEFETYGTYVYSHMPHNYELRQLATFRKGGYISGRFVSDSMIERLSFDLDTISFELRDYPPFPLSIVHFVYKSLIGIYAKCLK